MLAWYHDIEQLVQLPNMSLSQRQTFIASHAPEELLDRQRHSGSSSPGLDEDEADEVPYSQINPIEEATPHFPQRAPPGGSFPSETKLDDVAAYRRHSRAASDVTTSELNPLKISKEEDIAAVLDSHDMERPVTGGSDGSIGDDRDFTIAAIGMGVGATLAGDAITTAQIIDEHGDRELAHDNITSNVANSHEAVGYHAGTAFADHQLDHVGRIQTQPDSSGGEVNSIQPRGSTHANVIDQRMGDFVLGGTVGALSGAALASNSQHINPGQTDQSISTAGDEIETKPSIGKEVVPPGINGPTKGATLAPPTSDIQRSKSKKEIVEKTIAESIGNNPHRGMTPGAWPPTPAEERHKDGNVFE
jgi:hypothetical protein